MVRAPCGGVSAFAAEPADQRLTLGVEHHADDSALKRLRLEADEAAELQESVVARI
jgi:hypothetical protein